MIRNFISLLGPKISYGVTVNNETEEITKLLDILVKVIDKNDEIIVLQDITNENTEVTSILKSYGTKIKRVTACLNKDFATFKNNLISQATKDYLFQIDADEYPKNELIADLKWLLVRYYKYDCFLVPRINIVNGITPDDIVNWRWKVDENKYVNFPDYQNRIFRLKRNILWENKIHEVLINQKRTKKLAPEVLLFPLFRYLL